MSDWKKDAEDVLKQLIRAMKAGSERKLVYQLSLMLRDKIEGYGNFSRNLSELNECIDGRSQRTAEKAFRRGFNAGYNTALDHVYRDKRSQGDMLEFFNNELMDWENQRLKDLEFLLEPPPTIKPPLKKTRRK